MPAFCSCSDNGANTGAPNSQNVIGVGVKLIFVNTKADDGTLNFIADSDTIDSTFVNEKLNEVDKTKRWYPVGAFKNPNDNRDEPTYQEFDDGTRSMTRLGRRTWSGFLDAHSSRYLSKIESWSCQAFSIYEIDKCGNLVGRISADGTKLYPNKLNASSLAAILQKATPSAAGGINLSFDFDATMKDKDLRQVQAAEMSVDMLDIEGLRDVTSVISSITTDGFTASLTLAFDGFLSTDPVATGWALADFDIFNTTTAAPIVATGVTESPDGTYAIVIPTQTSADVLRLRSSKDEFDLGDVLITIP